MPSRGRAPAGSRRGIRGRTFEPDSRRNPSPLASKDASAGHLRLEMTVEGNYTPTKRGDVIVWNSPGRTLETRDLYAFDADGKQLSASMRASSGELSIEVDVADARYPIVIDPIWLEQQKLIASTASALGWFGYSVSVSGDSAIIGMPRDGDSGTDSGSAYVFVRSGSVWSQEQKLLASDGATVDRFGFSVMVEGGTAVIAAPLDDDKGSGSGSVYVFVRGGGVWSEQQKLSASDGAVDDQFGHSVGLSGDSVVVGARLDDDGANASGSAYVFVRRAAPTSALRSRPRRFDELLVMVASLLEEMQILRSGIGDTAIACAVKRRPARPAR